MDIDGMDETKSAEKLVVERLIEIENLKGAAQALIRLLQKFATDNKLWWDNPLINIDYLNNVVILEWWHSKRKLTLYINKNEIHFIKTWEVNMGDGTITSNDNFFLLWDWLCDRYHEQVAEQETE